jgi:uroporphyrinogen decarboxylase
MNKIERIIKTLNRENVDYLPSQITFADRTRNKEIAEALGLKNDEALDDYLENHLDFIFLKYDKPLFFRNDLDLMRKLEDEGIAGLDEENKIVYDIWGMGIRIGEDGFYYCYSPFQGDKEANKRAKPFLPPSFNLDLLDMEPKQAVKEFNPPEPTAKGNFEALKEDWDLIKDNVLAIPSGYFGIWERTNGMLGFKENLTYLILEPDTVEEMYEKITEYKIKVAHELIKMGFKVCHYGDDLAFQTSTFFSKEMYIKMLLPYHKRLFKVYKDAGVKIIYHSCGNVTPFLPELIDAGVDVLEPVQPCMDLNYLIDNFGKDLIFMGGIDTQNILPFGTPNEVKKHVKDVISILGRYGGYIIAPSQEIMKDVPIKNIIALIEAIKKERKID